MREPRLQPDVASALQVVREFARPLGLEGRYVDHWIEYLDIVSETEGGYRMIMVTIPSFAVQAVAAATVGEPAQSIKVRRGFGRVKPGHSGWEAELRDSLRKAWDWLQSQDAASIQALDAADAEHALCRIVPIVQEFAVGRSMVVSHAGRDRCILDWPHDGPRFQLAVIYWPIDGILFIGLHHVRRGRLIKRRITVECGDLSDLAIPDWTDLAGLPARLDEARARVEACLPGKDAVETYV